MRIKSKSRTPNFKNKMLKRAKMKLFKNTSNKLTSLMPSICPLFKSRLEVVVLCSCNLYGVESLLYLECVYEVVHSFYILQGFFHRFYSCI